MGGKLPIEAEVRPVEYRGDSIRYRVGVPLVQSMLAGLALVVALGAVILAAMYVDVLGVWTLLLLSGAGMFAYLCGWRMWMDIRAPYAQERATGEDTNRDGYIGDPRIRTDNARMDRLARQVIRLAHEGRSISRAALVPKLLTAGEWELLRKRLSGRGVVDLDRKGAMMMRHATYAESWARYTEGPRGSSWLVNQDGETVEAE
jgi:hypothetical protein